MILNKIPNRLHIIRPDFNDYNDLYKLCIDKVYHYYNIFLSYDDITKGNQEIIYSIRNIIEIISNISKEYVKKHPKSYKPKINIFILTLNYSRHHNHWWRNKAIYRIKPIMNEVLKNNSYCNYHIESCRYYTTEHGNCEYSIYKEGNFGKNNCRVLVIKRNIRTREDEILYDSSYINNIESNNTAIIKNIVYAYREIPIVPISDFERNVLLNQLNSLYEKIEKEDE